MNQVGKVGKRRQKGMKKAYPVVCERAGGQWNGTFCEGAMCEGYLPVYDQEGAIKAWLKCPHRAEDTAHITSRAQGGDESPDNLIVLCRPCHDLLDHGDRKTREALRERAKEIARGK